jgi:hypothetical protein
VLPADDLFHLIKQIARDEVGDLRGAAYGYVSRYDANSGAVQVRLPTYRFGDSTDYVTPWLPLATWMSGSGAGAQYHPPVGAPCLVIIVDSESGLSVAASMFYNDVFQPPFTSLGENDFGWQHTSGSYCQFFSGDVNLYGATGQTLTVGAGSFINLGSSTPLDYALKGTTANVSLNAAFASIAASLAAIATVLVDMTTPPFSVTYTTIAADAGACAAPLTATSALLAALPAQLQAALSAIVKIS